MHKEGKNTENPQPFDIIRNARSKGRKGGTKNRKHSYHTPVQKKKQRKMTIAIENENQIEQEEENQTQKVITEQYEYVGFEMNEIQKRDLFNLSENQGYFEQKNEMVDELQMGIPFKFDERELDKESPYLRSLGEIDDQMQEL